MPVAGEGGLAPATVMRAEIIILNYRTAELTAGCLRALEPEIAGSQVLHATVLDGGSGDHSVESLDTLIADKGWNTWAKLVALDENHGFAYGNNVALRHSLESPRPPEYFVLMNPDTEVRPGALSSLLNFMDAHPKIGIAGGRLEDRDGTPQVSAFRFPTPMSEFVSAMSLGILSRTFPRWVIAPEPPDEPSPTDWVAGACMVVRCEVFLDVGLMDESYFLYFEEVDFCLAAKRAGWQTWYMPEARVVHLVGMATGFSDYRRAATRRPRYWFESRRRFFLKNYGYFVAVLADFACLSGLSLRRLRYALQRKHWNGPPKFFADMLRHSALLHPRLS